ncbi:MAG: hypothetical protein C0501_31660 [Isosphaera sp.]|nr:hypothetical protein [Isosphaera sp.]
MNERRPLVAGLKPGGEADRALEKQFVYAGTAVEPPPARAPQPGRVPLTSRLRADYARALKRASLERELNRVEPFTVQEILEEALGPWLKAHGYLP